MQTPKSPPTLSKPYKRKPCPDRRAASPLELLFWCAAEDVTADVHAARAAGGHTAVSTLQKLVIASRVSYTEARASRLAEAARVLTSGDAEEQLAAVFSLLGALPQDRIVARFAAVVEARRAVAG